MLTYRSWPRSFGPLIGFSLIALVAALSAVSPQTTPQTATAQVAPGCTSSAVKMWTSGTGANGHGYQLICTTPGISWTAARDAAVALGGHLVTFSSQDELDFVGQGWEPPDLTPGSCGCNFWAGGSQPGGQATPDAGWQWVTGEAWSFTNWPGGEPNDNDGAENSEENYLELSSENYWNDQDLTDSLTLAYIVEYETMITICKIASTDDEFDFDLDFGVQLSAVNQIISDLVLSNGECEPFFVSPGTYHVTEIGPHAGMLLGIVCTGTGESSTAGWTATIVLDSGESVTCTFYNGRRALDELDESCDFTSDHCPTPTPTPTPTSTPVPGATATPTPTGSSNNIGGIFAGIIGQAPAGVRNQPTPAPAVTGPATISPPNTGDGGLR